MKKNVSKLSLFFTLFSIVFIALAQVQQPNLPPQLPQNPFLILNVSSTNGDFAGISSDFIGDINGDGFSEIIIGAPGTAQNINFIGKAYLIDGKYGTVLNTFNGTTSGGRFGYSVANLGDVNGDTFPEVVVSEPLGLGNLYNGIIYVYELNGNLLFRYNLNNQLGGNYFSQLENIGDMNGDSINDIAIGNSAELYVKVISGIDGTLIRSISSPQTPAYPSGILSFGTSIAGLGDINGDGYKDIAVGAPNVGPPINAGAVYIFSGYDGSQITSFSGNSSNEFFGNDITKVKDYNNDNITDLAITAPGGNFFSGHTDIYSTSNNFVHLVRISLPIGANSAYSIDSGDINGDGLSDIIVGGGANGALYAYNGGNGNLLYYWPSAISYPLFTNPGYKITVADINTDGFSEILSGYISVNSPGRVIVRSLGGAWSYGHNLNNPLTLTWTKTATNNLGSGLLTVIGATQNSSGYVVISSSPLNAPTQYGYVYVDPTNITATIPVLFDAAGSASANINLRDISQPGITHYIQVTETIQSGGHRLSNGIMTTFVN